MKMVDSFSKEVRSRIMSSVRGRDTKPEIAFRHSLWKRGYRYRNHYKIGSYRADIALPSKKIAIMIDGCFWHGCPIHFKMPKSNLRYWKSKIKGNMLRDRKTNRYLSASGWKVLRFWEHDIGSRLDVCMGRVDAAYKSA